MNFEAMLERVAREAAKEQWPGYSHGQDVFLPRYIAVLRRELLPVLLAGEGLDSCSWCEQHKDAWRAALANLAGGEGKR